MHIGHVAPGVTVSVIQALRRLVGLGVISLASACGGGGGGGGSGTPPPQPTPSQLTITAGNQQTAQVATKLPTTLAVKVTDSGGMAMSGVAVAWAVTAGGGSLTSETTNTDSNGAATAQWTLGTVSGPNAATATVGSLMPATFSATGTAGPLASMILGNPKNPLFTGDSITITAAATDQYGNTVANVSPSWSATPSAVVTVSASGSVTAVAPGAGFITATSGAISTILPVVVNGNTTFTLGAEEVVFQHSTDACSTWDVPDVPAKAVRLPDGSLTLIADNAPGNYASFGGNFSSLKRSCTTPILTSGVSSSASVFDNEEWVHAVYLVGSTVYALIHNEYHDPVSSNCSPGNPLPGNPCWYNSILFASSSDGGHTYVQPALPGQLVAPAPVQWNAGPPTPGPYGYFNPSNIVLATDGNYYAMFMSIPNPGSTATIGMCLMRTATLGDPSSWRAWDGAGFNLQMTDPYSGPAPNWCTPVIPNSGFVGSLTFNTYLGAYMVVWDYFGAAGCGTIFQTSTDLIHWGAVTWLRAGYGPPLLAGGTTTACPTPNGVTAMAYSSVIDHGDSTANFEKPGQTPYLYYTRFNPGSPSDRDLVRVPLTITQH